MISGKNIMRHELIGLDIQVTAYPDPTVMGMRGKIVDETRQTFRVSTERGEKMIAKQDLVFDAFVEEQIFKIHGNKIMFRPEDRPKRVKQGG